MGADPLDCFGFRITTPALQVANFLLAMCFVELIAALVSGEFVIEQSFRVVAEVDPGDDKVKFL